MRTLLLPSYFASLASISPKALETDNFPGYILKGPNTVFPFLFFIEL